MCLDHVRQLTRYRKWKHKEGRDSSHSYWSQTHGPTGTTHGTSGRRPWRWMVSRRGFLPPAGCRGSFSWQPRYLNGGGGTKRRTGIADRYQGFPPRALNIGQRDPSGVPVVALPSFLGYSGGFRDADFFIY